MKTTRIEVGAQRTGSADTGPSGARIERAATPVQMPHEILSREESA